MMGKLINNRPRLPRAYSAGAEGCQTNKSQDQDERETKATNKKSKKGSRSLLAREVRRWSKEEASGKED
jgi:hypothetical protein